VTIIGDGKQEGGKTQGMSSPWDITPIHTKGNKFLVAMAGSHQIWKLNLRKRDCRNFSGTGDEKHLNSADGILQACWAQPSGIACCLCEKRENMREVYVADSESSTVRLIRWRQKKGETATLCGGVEGQPQNLFVFGDVDGCGEPARLQHPMAVVWVSAKGGCWQKREETVEATTGEKEKEQERESGKEKEKEKEKEQEQAKEKEKKKKKEKEKERETKDGRVIVADSYNHQLKILDPTSKKIVSWLGGQGDTKRGYVDGDWREVAFAEPSGLCFSRRLGKLFVADTNNHVVRVVDIHTGNTATTHLHFSSPGSRNKETEN